MAVHNKQFLEAILQTNQLREAFHNLLKFGNPSCANLRPFSRNTWEIGGAYQQARLFLMPPFLFMACAVSVTPSLLRPLGDGKPQLSEQHNPKKSKQENPTFRLTDQPAQLNTTNHADDFQHLNSWRVAGWMRWMGWLGWARG